MQNLLILKISKNSLGYDLSYPFVYIEQLTEAGYTAKDIKDKIVLIERDTEKTYDDMKMCIRDSCCVGQSL